MELRRIDLPRELPELLAAANAIMHQSKLRWSLRILAIVRPVLWLFLVAYALVMGITVYMSPLLGVVFVCLFAVSWHLLPRVHPRESPLLVLLCMACLMPVPLIAFILLSKMHQQQYKSEINHEVEADPRREAVVRLFMSVRHYNELLERCEQTPETSALVIVLLQYARLMWESFLPALRDLLYLRPMGRPVPPTDDLEGAINQFCDIVYTALRASRLPTQTDA